MRQQVTCPVSCQAHEIEFDESPIDGTILGVRSCTVFHPKDIVMCEGACIDHLNASFLMHVHDTNAVRDALEVDDSELA